MARPPVLAPEFFDTPQFRAAFASREMGKVLRVYRSDPRHWPVYGGGGIGQDLLGTWLGLTQVQVSRMETGKVVPKHLDTLTHYARTLHLPQNLLWFDLPNSSRLATTALDHGDPSHVSAPAESESDSSQPEGDTLAADQSVSDHEQPERKRAYEITPNRELIAAREAVQSKAVPIPGAVMSRAELAEAVNAYLWRETNTRYALDDHAIGRYERGEVRWPSAAYRAAFRAVLGAANDTDLGFYPTARGTTVRSSTVPNTQDPAGQAEPLESPGEGHPVNRRGFLVAGGVAAFDAALSSPTPVLQALQIVASDDADTLAVAVDCLNELVSHYSERLFVASPAGMYADLLNVRAYAGAVLGRSTSATRQQPDLVVAAGWLSNLLAVATSYMGDHGSALVWCVDAQRRGDESGNRDIAAWAALTRAMIAYYQGRTARSIELACDGLAAAPVGTAVHAKLAAHEMRARAMLGDAEGMAQAKTRATQAITRLSPDVATTGVFSIAPSEDPPYTATSLLLVNRFQEAAAATNTVIHARVSGQHAQAHKQSSSYARALLILGLAKAGTGDIDQAAAAGRAALECSGLVWPTLVLAGKLDQALTRDHNNAPETADYHALYRDTAARATREFQRSIPAPAATGE